MYSLFHRLVSDFSLFGVTFDTCFILFESDILNLEIGFSIFQLEKNFIFGQDYIQK